MPVTAIAERPVTDLKGVGTALALKLQRLGIHQLQDLFFHLPARYQDRTRLSAMGGLMPSIEAVVEGEVQLCDIQMGRRRALLCRLHDGTGSLTLRFFHFNAAQKNQLCKGARVRCFGEVRPGPAGLEMVHPEYRVLKAGKEEPLEQALTPIYPLTEGVTQSRLRSLILQALEMLGSQPLDELVPETELKRRNYPALTDAIHYLHKPPVDADQQALLSGSHPAQRRLAFEELLAHNLTLRQARTKIQRYGAPPLKATGRLSRPFLDQLPFQLTGAQLRVAREVARDMNSEQPMLRLVQGDVGSGKTMIAVLAALQSIENGRQAAVMAPTEILAEQHYINFKGWLEPMGLKVCWLAGKVKGKARAAVLAEIESGEGQIIVGTHALFQDDVHFNDLAMVVIDEQHRFGVDQRLSLREKGRKDGTLPHQLIMTATPIPRTLAMSAYADLDCSIIDELPPGRTPVKTLAIDDSRRAEVIERVRQGCSQGKQAYWVCTLIEESEALQCQAAETTATELAELLPELRIGLVHGRLKPAEKAEIMARFKAHELDLLVATTVIEVGVDVPNSSLMIIENPERLGLSQLHQLRGRVGRGSQESFCVLMYHAPLSQQGRERIAVMRETTDGFRIAERDLQLRGPGEVLGTRQTGMMQFRIADLQRDADLMEAVHQCAVHISSESTQALALGRRWISDAEQYAQV
jgi:ATP-dependent DNA helicase RecG